MSRSFWRYVSWTHQLIYSFGLSSKPPVSNASHLVEELKSKCKPLLEGDVDSEGKIFKCSLFLTTKPECDDSWAIAGLSSGQMLLMGFNGLFTKLEQDFWHFRETSIPVLATMHSLWRKVDLIKEAHTHLVSFQSNICVVVSMTCVVFLAMDLTNGFPY